MNDLIFVSIYLILLGIIVFLLSLHLRLNELEDKRWQELV
jgi:hypothetical protein